MYKIVIVEDDPFAREMLQDLILKKANDYTVIGFYDSVKSAGKSLSSLNPDLVFLDMELKDGNGFEILEKLPLIKFEVVVTTQHDSFLLQAIKHSALDYIYKPVTKTSLDKVIERFEAKITTSVSGINTKSLARTNKLILPMNEGLMFINISDIIRLASDGSYTTFYTTDGKKFTTSRNLAVYETQLQDHSFFRVHHGHIINLNFILKYVKGEGGYVVMSDQSTVDVSRRKKDEFLKALGQ